MHKRQFLKLGLAAFAAPVVTAPAALAQSGLRLMSASFQSADFHRAASIFMMQNLHFAGVPQQNVRFGMPISGFPRPDRGVRTSLGEFGFGGLGDGLMSFNDLVGRMQPDSLAGWMSTEMGAPPLEAQLAESFKEFQAFSESLQSLGSTSLTGLEIAGLIIGIGSLGIGIYTVYDGWESDADGAFRDRYNLEPHEDYDNDGTDNVHDDDIDGDGVRNADDRAPTDPGSSFNLPDRDGNGIPDELEDDMIFGAGGYLLSSILTGAGVAHLVDANLKVAVSLTVEGDSLMVDTALDLGGTGLVQRTEITA